MRTTTALPALLVALVAIGRSQSSDLELCKNSYDYPKIVRYCSAAIDSGKLSENELAEAFWKRGYWSLRGNPDLAIHDYTELIQRKPNDPDSFRHRANAYEEKGVYVQALRDYSHAIQLRPRNADAMARAVDFSDRGRTYYEMGAFHRAIQDYDRSLTIKPDDLTLGDRANAYCSMGNYTRAFRITLKRFGREDPLKVLFFRLSAESATTPKAITVEPCRTSSTHGTSWTTMWIRASGLIWQECAWAKGTRWLN